MVGNVSTKACNAAMVECAMIRFGGLHTLVLNGAECEPYISCDEMIMRNRAEDIVQGALLLLHITGAARCLIAIEDPTQAACGSFMTALQTIRPNNILMQRVPTIYPEGGEKQLIKVLSGHEIPTGGLPSDLGFLVQNVTTAAHVYDAIVRGRPSVSRIVTVTGPGVAQPANFEVLFGTPISDVIAEAGGYTAAAERLIMGGPMMGMALPHDQLPVVKATNCLLVLDAKSVRKSHTEMPCIRCGACTRVCPMRLAPQQIYQQIVAERFERAQEQNLFDCIECGCCAQACPSHIPLVSYYRHAKGEIRYRRKKKAKADRARVRHDAQEARIAREKAQRAARAAERKAKLKLSRGKTDTTTSARPGNKEKQT